MIEVFRFFRLGIINLVGITVPGMLILLFALAGAAVPSLTLALHANEAAFGSGGAALWSPVYAFYRENAGILLLLLVVLAYVIGYVVRLSSPDELDIISARKALRIMEKGSPLEAATGAQDDSWPYRGEKGDKFPYFHFRDYLASRGLPHLAELVTWGPPGEEPPKSSGRDVPMAPGKRTKTQVNLMKLEICTCSPELGAVVESNEAHVRLLFGTWYAVVTCRWLIWVGLVVSLGGYGINFLPRFRGACVTEPYLFSLFLGATLLLGMVWARRRIENLFHYQRVRELTHILGAYHLATQEVPPAADQAGPVATPARGRGRRAPAPGGR